VLTDDEEVAQVARRAGARVRLKVPDPGLNPAIEQAGSELLEEGREATLVVLGDLPGLRASDVEAVLAEGARAPVVIVPSADGGTAMLYRRPPDVMPARFGPESSALHEKEARAAGIEPVVMALDERASLDLDTPEDVERLLASGVESRTRAVLERVKR
jgi:2-phospho-L-lactate guanylyltransferase